MKEVFTAASDGNEDLLKRCIADGTDVDGYKDEVRPSLLCFVLFERDSHYSYLKCRTSKNVANCIRMLAHVLKLLSLSHSDEQKGNTALIAATEKNNPAVVKLLLEAGADKDAKDNVRL